MALIRHSPAPFLWAVLSLSRKPRSTFSFPLFFAASKRFLFFLWPSHPPEQLKKSEKRRHKKNTRNIMGHPNAPYRKEGDISKEEKVEERAGPGQSEDPRETKSTRLPALRGGTRDIPDDREKKKSHVVSRRKPLAPSSRCYHRSCTPSRIRTQGIRGNTTRHKDQAPEDSEPDEFWGRPSNSMGPGQEWEEDRAELVGAPMRWPTVA